MSNRSYVLKREGLMSGGPSTVQGIYYQVTISVKRLLTMLNDCEIDKIIVEAKNKEEEDINIFYRNGKIIYEQVKTKRRGFWSFNEFFSKVFPTFLNLFENSKNPKLIFFGFVSNASPDNKLASLIHDIIPIITEKNLFQQLKRIPSIANNNLSLVKQWSPSEIVNVLTRFQPSFPYFSSEDPNKPEKYISEYIKQQICLKCGKTEDESKRIFNELHNLAFERSKYRERTKRTLRRKDISHILSPCIPREQTWRIELESTFPKDISDIIFKEILLGRLYYPEFNIKFYIEDIIWDINMRIHSKSVIYLFKLVSETWSSSTRNLIIHLNRYINQQKDIELICISDRRLPAYPDGIKVISTDLQSLEELKALLRG